MYSLTFLRIMLKQILISLNVKLCSMLPQTTYKIWGINDIEFKEFYQFEYVSRYKGWESHAEPIYKLNQMICNFSGINETRFISTKSKIRINQAVYDQQIFNRIINFPGLETEGEKSLISYTSNTYNLTNYSDLRYGLSGLRNIYRNYKFDRKNKIDGVYSVLFPWNEYMVKRKRLFWENHYIFSSDLKRKSVDFIEANKKHFPEIIQMKKQDKTLLINPHVNLSMENFKLFVERHQSFFNLWMDTCIFVKHHRTTEIKFPQEFKVGKNRFYTISSDLTFLLPTEVIYYAIDHIKVLTAGSGLLALNQNIILELPFTTVQEKDYKLLLKQLGKSSQIEYIK